MKNDPLGAFVPGVSVEVAGAERGSLVGLSFAAKDIFDVAGYKTGCGNPDWARTHDAATATAPAVERLLDAGARLAGKTVTDELAYSLNGQNHHYGTPTNANAPGRIPGGSSSGSAAAVAGGLVDFALGSDTGGSVRVPASYCGIFGFRPSHGRVPLTGVMPLASSFDTVGWFARDAGLMRRVGEVLLDQPGTRVSAPTGLLLAEDAFALAEKGVRPELAPHITRLEGRLGRARSVSVSEPDGLEAWMGRFRTIQAAEIRTQHGAWIEGVKPRFGPEIAQRFAWALTVTDDEAAPARAAREDFATRLQELLSGGGVLCLPTVPGMAPLMRTPAEALSEHRNRVLSLTCIAGLARLPQITLPLASVEGCPVGLSLIGARGHDMMLLSFAEAFTED